MTEAKKVEAFNAAHPVGTKVIIERRGEKEETRTRAPAELLSGHTAVVWVEASSSCISLDHVEIVSEETGPGGTSLEGVYFEIQEERARQDAQWGGPSVDDERDAPHWSRVRTKFEMRLIAAARGALVSADDINIERDSLVKLAALCVAQIESMDRTERRIELVKRAVGSVRQDAHGRRLVGEPENEA